MSYIKKITYYILLLILVGTISCEEQDNSNGSTGKIGTLKISLDYPSVEFPQYSKGSDYILRAVVELYYKGTQSCVIRKVYNATDAISFTLSHGEYEVRVWSDYSTDITEDLFYNSSQINYITIPSSEEYSGNNLYKEAFYGISTAVVNSSTTQSTHTITLQRPMAQYKIVATDVAEYNELRVESGYPELSDIIVNISYDSYLPTAFNPTTSLLAGAELGYSFASSITDTTSTEATIASDFILSNSGESTSSVTITLCSSKGDTISWSKGNTIPYKLGYTTTLSGNFLTSKESNGGNSNEGGLSIDPSWNDNEYFVTF